MKCLGMMSTERSAREIPVHLFPTVASMLFGLVYAIADYNIMLMNDVDGGLKEMITAARVSLSLPRL